MNSTFIDSFQIQNIQQKKFGINYNDPTDANTTALYNGNISEKHWRTQNISKDKRMYSYEYDALNLLTEANYSNLDSGLAGNEAENFYAGGLSYDKNGNIKRLIHYRLKKQNLLTRLFLDQVHLCLEVMLLPTN
ncbi:hypothetical protein [Psychroflexus sp. MES1-P1E]|uniref:hypothetical protein n=1 Tax=Psychroflexus sp. MES1-P1E TaxID=2058320 RepID=UPI000C7ADA8A|nr:hypothetical protein [Psychroflexus sp. MES1-P1E]PKG42685.1 hypothetical protein CXF67_08970 [Psychroflexus sp. MES1-P1E]